MNRIRQLWKETFWRSRRSLETRSLHLIKRSRIRPRSWRFRWRASRRLWKGKVEVIVTQCPKRSLYYSKTVSKTRSIYGKVNNLPSLNPQRPLKKIATKKWQPHKTKKKSARKCLKIIDNLSSKSPHLMQKISQWDHKTAGRCLKRRRNPRSASRT